MKKVSRRIFLIAGGTAMGGLALGTGYLASLDTAGLSTDIDENGNVQLNAWVHIRTDGKIALAIPRVEMGQGVFTSLPMLIAEELDINIDDPNLVVEHPTALLPAYSNFTIATFKRPEAHRGSLDWTMAKVAALFPYIGTGGSTSVVDGYQSLRQAGASAREMLKQAAAHRWRTSSEYLRTENAYVINDERQERLSYAALANDAARLGPPRQVNLKPKKSWQIIGKSVPRTDLRAKTHGEAVFGIDVEHAEMHYAYVINAPVMADTVASYNEREILQLPRVVSIVNLDSAVAVVAETYYHAMRAAKALKIEYHDGGNRHFSDADVLKAFDQAFSSGDTHVAESRGELSALEQSDNLISAQYHQPYLAHACMEPMDCTALYHDGEVEMWGPVQTPLALKWAADKNVDDLKSFSGHVTFAGGGFGRRAEMDYSFQAMRIAKANPGKAIKLIWSREQDIQHDMYRPAATAKCRARLNDDGTPQAIAIDVALQSVNLSFSERNLPFPQGGAEDPLNTEGLVASPYALPNFKVTAHEVELPAPIGNWRSVGHSNNAFFMESFIDELAHAAAQDPLEYRAALLAHDKRAARLAEKLKSVAAWQGPSIAATENGKDGRGVAIHASFRSLVGQVVDVSVTDKKVKVNKVVCVVDCGTVIHPDTVKAQMESGIAFALSAAAFGEINFANGRVQQSNFHDYDMVRMAQCPRIEVYIMDNDELPGGVGEPGTPPFFAAFTNAIFAATGQRLRELPISKHGLRLV